MTTIPKVETDTVCTVYSLPIRIDGTLIDFETTGIPGRTPTSEVITLGLLTGSELRIIQRTTPGKDLFYAHITGILNGLQHPLYSYNTGFEKSILRYELGMEVGDGDFIDIMEPWKRKAEEKGVKWPKLDELVSEPEDYFGDAKVSGRLVPVLWQVYLQSSGKVEVLRMIMDHCASDVFREAMLLLRYPGIG